MARHCIHIYDPWDSESGVDRDNVFFTAWKLLWSGFCVAATYLPSFNKIAGLDVQVRGWPIVHLGLKIDDFRVCSKILFEKEWN